jgi:hypothetical protein
MPEPYNFSSQEILDFLGKEGVTFKEHLSSIFTIMQEAQNLGSIMKFNLPDPARAFFVNRIQELRQKLSLSFHEQAVLPRITPFIQVFSILSSKYKAVAANPPYMGQKHMNGKLKNYVNANYNISKSDLFAVFMEVCSNLLIQGGLYGMINQQNWMFLSSYETLRERILNTMHIKSMLHLGPRTFDELSGEVVQNTAFVIQNKYFVNATATYYRLIDFRSSNEKHQNFLSRSNEFNSVLQSNFCKVSGKTIAYWISDNFIRFLSLPKIAVIANVKAGLSTGDNNKFIRFWQEVSFPTIRFKNTQLNNYWIPLNKGGNVRKWYGNNQLIVYWKNDGYDIKHFKDETGYLRSRPQGLEFNFTYGITWSALSTELNARISNDYFIYGSKGPSITLKHNEDDQDIIKLILANINCKISKEVIKIQSQSFSFEVGHIANLPIKLDFDEVLKRRIVECTDYCISKAKTDWDSHETSCDFQKHPLLYITNSNLEQNFQFWLQQASSNFFQIHYNEEELNRIFIDQYGLSKEFTPDVALKDITILQGELDYTALGKMKQSYNEQLVPVKKAVIMQQLVSYAIGCFMGRYRLNNPGLHIAHPNPVKEEITSYTYNGSNFEIDDDAIIPLMGSACAFPDDAVTRFKYFLDIIWGEKTRIENLNFLQECLDQDVEEFIVKDFWKVHCRMYSKKPIYWLFSSQKGAFQVLVYMHRMNAFTVDKIRSKYLMDHLRNIRSKISLMEKSESTLNTQDYKTLDKLRKSLQECEQYDMALKPIADKQIIFDLDDGVTENYKLFKGVVAEIK